MVAYAPLEYGEQVRSYLDALMVHGTFIKGVRRGLPSPTDTTFPMDHFIRGIQILPEYGLSFDILGKGTPHLDMAIKIAQSAPNTSLIIDHLLKPFIKERQLEPWHTHAVARAIATRGKSFLEGITDHLISNYIRGLEGKAGVNQAEVRRRIRVD